MVYIANFFHNISQKFRKIYLNSNFYEKKISKIISNDLSYKPSPHLVASLVKYQKKRFKIEDYIIDEIWNNENINKKDFKNLNSFYWFFNLDLKSSKEKIQMIIRNWIDRNHKYDSQSWEFDLTAKRIIAWLSCHNLSFDQSNSDYKEKFNLMIKKQTNHLINEISKSRSVDNKLIGCASIILVGLSYKDEKNYLFYGLDVLKKISKTTLDNRGFPKSRNIKQLIFYLKYFILIREWFKESQNNVPEHVDETIYHLGQGYAFIWQNTGSDFLFNGNNLSNNNDFDNYLKKLGYKFNNDDQELGGYTILKNKKTCLIIDSGSSPEYEFSKDYQSGALSIEIVSNGKKLISNCGYYKKNINLNRLSKSSAAQSTLIIDDSSSCKFIKINKSLMLKKSIKILKKKIVFEKDYWKVNFSHDGYLKDYNSIHERQIEFFPNKMTFIGIDKIIKNMHWYFTFLNHLKVISFIM